VHIVLYTIRCYLIDIPYLVVLIVGGLRKTPGRHNIKKYTKKKSPVNMECCNVKTRKHNGPYTRKHHVEYKIAK